MQVLKGGEKETLLGSLPSIDDLLGTEPVLSMISELGRSPALSLARQAMEAMREELKEDSTRLSAGGREITRELLIEELTKRLDLAFELERHAKIQRVINATGVVNHTNLGRAPLSEQARQAMAEAAGYCNVEYDISTGKRGTRCANAERLLSSLTGAEAALIVNNCAAAALLVLSVIANGSEVLVSRGELVEIGGDFRIPDVLAQSGAVLKEVGTTNRTNLGDFERAIGENSAVILRVHPSNYRITGFTDKPSITELADLAHEKGLILFEDAGSGALTDLTDMGLADEPVISRSLASGADIVTFSGDKLLGGPQAGLIVGRSDLIERLRKHPLYRAVRVDKMICAALEATLLSYARGAEMTEVPVLRMLSMSGDEINERARSFKARSATVLGTESELTLEIVAGNSAVGGGAAPDVSLVTSLISLAHSRYSDNKLERLLRLSKPAVITRMFGNRVVIDLRTVAEGEEIELIEILRSIAIN